MQPSVNPSRPYTRAMGDELSQLWPVLFPGDVRCVELSDPALAKPLFPAEEAAIARAVDKRKLEFALGRTAARQALAQLGIAPVALPQNKDRSVEWPAAAWGSITHADGICAAVATLRTQHAGVGLDAELRERVKRELWGHIATEREQRWLSEHEPLSAARATLLFSAKEAFYKAQFCVSRAWVGFLDAELEFDEHGAFELRLRKDVGDSFRVGARFEGRYATTTRHVLTGLVL
jgi:4'-phosphopantetheinyl transferase EntD